MDEYTRNPIEELFERFLNERRQGKSVSIESFADRYPPALAQEIRSLFPAIAVLEDIYRPNSPPVELADGKDLKGTRFGDYELLAEAGRGGMGVVYHARHCSLGKEVAVKVLPRHLASEAYKLRFLREARSAARLHHSNIVPVFDFGTQGVNYYYVMQYIRGQSLASLLRSATERASDLTASRKLIFGSVGQDHATLRSPPDSHDIGTRDTLPISHAASATDSARLGVSGGGREFWKLVAEIGLQVAEGLSHAHSRNVIHRDIKPGNLLIDDNGHVWIADFGLAKSDEEDELTRTGDILGTLRYLAPETLHGKVDERSDICSLGLTLYELAAQRPAYCQVDRPALLHQITESNPDALSTTCRGIPYDLETIIHKAIERDPSDRYQTARELAGDLQRFLNSEPIHARRTSLAGVLARWARRNPALAFATSTILVLLVAASAVSTLVAYRFSVISDDLRNALNVSQEMQRTASQAELKSKKHLYDASVIAARSSLVTGMPAQRHAALHSIRIAEPLVDPLGLDERARSELQSLAIKALSLVDVSPVWEVDNRQAGRDPWAMAYPECDLYITSKFWPARQLQLRRISDGSLWTTTEETADGIHWFQYNTQHRLLAIVHGPYPGNLPVRIWRVTPDGQLVDFYSRERSFTERGIDISSHSPALGVMIDDRTLEIISAVTGETIHQYQFPSNIYGVRIAADGTKAVAWGFNSRCYLVDLASHTVSPLPSVTAKWYVDLSDDGRLLATQDGSVNVRVWDLESQRVVTSLTTTSEVSHVDLHPNNEFVVTESWDHHIRIWDRSGTLVLSCQGFRPRFSEDGQHLSYMHGHRMGYLEFTSPKAYKSRSMATLHTIRSELSSHGFWAIYSDGVAFYDAAFERRIGRIQFNARIHSDGILLPDQTAILAVAHRGILQWPISRDGEECTIGPPLRIDLGFDADGEVVTSETGELVAVGGPTCFAIMRKRESEWDVQRICHPGTCRQLSISPDGRWLAVGYEDCTVFDTKTGDSLVHFDIAGGPQFDGSGRYLVLAGLQNPTIVDTKDWSPTPWEYPGVLARQSVLRRSSISLIADDHARCSRLFDFSANRLLARLPVANPRSTTDEPSFLDGNVSTVMTAYRHSGNARLSIWDLQQLRSELGDLNLDWDAPPIEQSALRPENPARSFRFLTYPTEHEQVQRDPDNGGIVLEAPCLVASATNTANPPQLIETIYESSPTSFGRYSGETRLSWKPQSRDERLRIPFDVPAAGIYSVHLSMGLSPRRGICRVFVNDHPVGDALDRYTNLTVGLGTDRLLPPSQAIGQVQLLQGRNTVSFQIVGRHPDAKDERLGIDHIHFDLIKSPAR